MSSDHSEEKLSQACSVSLERDSGAQVADFS